MKVRKLRGALALVTVGLLAVSLSACVSDTNATGGAQGSTDKANLACGLANHKPATGEPIKVGAIATASGGVDFSSSPTAATAYFDCVNDNGGINGRPIDYSWQDDALDPTKTAQLAAGYAADTSVVGLVGDATFIGCDVANAEYKKADLYSITAVGVPQACYNSSNIASVIGGPRISAIGLLQYLNEKGLAGRVFQVGFNTQGNGDWVAAGINAYAQEHNINIVGSELSDPSETNWLPLLQKIKDANPTAVIIVDPASTTAAILAAAEQQDMRGNISWACTASCYDSQFGQQIGSYWEGFIANSDLELIDGTGKDNELWKSVMDAYAPGDAPRDTFSQAGFLAAKMFTDTLLGMKGDITRDTVSKAVVGIKNYTSDLLCAPWYYGEADSHNANHSMLTATIKNGAYEKLEGCKPIEDSALAPILEREQSEGLVG